MKKMVLMAGLVALLSGCAHPDHDKAQAIAVEKAKTVSITCKIGPDCDQKWVRATQWVSTNAPFKLRIATDTVIATEEGPLDSGFSSVESAITVNKVPNGDGTSTIAFKSRCANKFVCTPSKELLLVTFAGYVNQK